MNDTFVGHQKIQTRGSSKASEKTPLLYCVNVQTT